MVLCGLSVRAGFFSSSSWDVLIWPAPRPRLGLMKVKKEKEKHSRRERERQKNETGRRCVFIKTLVKPAVEDVKAAVPVGLWSKDREVFYTTKKPFMRFLSAKQTFNTFAFSRKWCGKKQQLMRPEKGRHVYLSFLGVWFVCSVCWWRWLNFPSGSWKLEETWCERRKRHPGCDGKPAVHPILRVKVCVCVCVCVELMTSKKLRRRVSAVTSRRGHARPIWEAPNDSGKILNSSNRHTHTHTHTHTHRQKKLPLSFFLSSFSLRVCKQPKDASGLIRITAAVSDSVLLGETKNSREQTWRESGERFPPSTGRPSDSTGGVQWPSGQVTPVGDVTPEESVRFFAIPRWRVASRPRKHHRVLELGVWACVQTKCFICREGNNETSVVVSVSAPPRGALHSHLTRIHSNRKRSVCLFAPDLFLQTKRTFFNCTI